MATWLYWIWRGLTARHMRLIAGTAFTLEDLAAQFPRAKIRRQFFDSLAYNLFVAVEEGMEMAGIVMFIDAQLQYLQADGAAVVPVTGE